MRSAALPTVCGGGSWRGLLVAEIVRWSSTKSTRLFSRRDAGSEQVEVREKVIVRSIAGARPDVSVLRDFVAALDAAEVSSRASVEYVVVDGRVSQLVMEAELEPPVRCEAVPVEGQS